MNTQEQTKQVRVAVDLYTRICLTAIAVLLTAVVIGLWAEAPTAPTAWGQEPYRPTLGPRNVLPDSGAQRNEMIEQLRSISGKLDEIQRTLVSGQVKVTVVEAENKDEGKANALPPKTK